MFPQYRELISELKVSNHHFQRIFDEHNQLDHEINNIEKHPAEFAEELSAKKLRKLALKEELLVILKQHETA
ncbi:DUF465 domain-containing protein [Shewanella sp. SNU WT4]|uniref:YdcH family protein n=1 Tax=Shewanella sp. SNU WT4 TaxID=2590015 RepID=UPI0011290138|nr:DUF465 domain-containing protein [Shewanella sp. SNU WT4]QDF65910.1 DUF465 domain-containing protein [Shewanella sp. SNU WT4]